MTAPTDVDAANGPSFDAEAYATFIGQIELEAIWLVSSRITNYVGTRQPIQAELIIESRPQWNPRPTGFDVELTYTVAVRGEQAAALEIEAAYGLSYASRQPMTDEMFAMFAEANLPLNAWPYLREYVASVFGRVGWLPFTLPALKRGVPPTETDDEPAHPTPPKRPRKRKAADKAA